MGNQLIDNFLAGTAAIAGKRAELILETVRDIGRPQQNIFGQLAGLLGREEELDTPEEVPTLE